MSEALAPPGQAAKSGDGGLTHRQILTVLSGLMMGMFLAALDQTIVASAMRVIADELHGQTAQAWATTAYLITATITTPLYGKLSDIYGRKPLYLTAIGLFLIGSVLCGLAQSIYELAAYRAVQGLGAGGLMSLAMTIIADMVAPRQRARYQGYILAVFGVSSVLGPVVGGFFAGQESLLGIAGWRWVFLVNVPVALIALVVVAKVLNLPHNRVDHRIDYWGAAALVLALVPLLIVAEQGREWGWGAGISLLMYVIGAVGIVAFVLVERRMGDEALLPPRLFRSGTFRLGNLLSFVVGVGMFGGMVSLPLYLQIVKGQSPTDAGLLMLPLTFGIMTATLVVGRLIARTGKIKMFPVLGAGVMATALLLFATIDADTSLVLLGALMVLFGVGLGLSMQTLTLLVQNDAPPADNGSATAAVTFFRQTGGTAGTAIFLSILFSVLASRIADAFTSSVNDPAFNAALRDPQVLSDPANQEFIQSVQGGGTALDLNDTSFLGTIDPRLAAPVLDGFASAMSTVFLVGGLVMLAAFLLSWFVPDVELGNQSGIQRIQAERAEAERVARQADGEAGPAETGEGSDRAGRGERASASAGGGGRGRAAEG
ncbi:MULTISPECIES: MDR family MFS transporter [Actinoalloteichus]|uniref:Drug resistance transporter, EmrB/QacA subfamily n=1 Tax=Actinoalloteichus fjordicus TaxID=1612552 RepID=A0AAC9L728_9PSEU|nr:MULTISPECIES: MDR family MFS transporter [Actinoalloteichus]APU12388.1 drug resistance transporter, EmrB/QacA subfamily [Actinoalloteichus fjordicus]APU18340.1 drug resistance transporter, EmrB/QacA subfamily [Actinoalloteichus sp. GBA129-24]